jgi:GntR family transcriptional regulator
VTEPTTTAAPPGGDEHPHRRIATSIRGRIRLGEWGAGERLPSIPALAEAYGVAKQTVQRAVDQLRLEGQLITRPGSGTYVRGTRRRLNRLSRGRYGTRRGYHTDLAARYRQRLLAVATRPAPPDVADAFGVRDGTALLCRQYLVVSDEQQPVELGASWFLADEAGSTSLARPEAFGRPLYQEAEDATGRTYVTAADHLSARLPTRDEAEFLHLRADTPVLHLLHVAYDRDHRPIEVAQVTWPGPMTVLTETYPVPAELPDTIGPPDLP